MEGKPTPDDPSDNEADTSANRRWPTWRRLLLIVGAIVVGLLVLIQAVPYGRDHTNPPVTATTTWDSPQTQSLFATACGDCHSNETEWPWYSNIAPVSWLTEKDVKDGREELNISEAQSEVEVEEMVEVIRDGSMPPWFYTIPHPDADLSSREKEALITGLEATFLGRETTDPRGEEAESEDEQDES
jgi:mono/diheme cytochrome c family protein